MKNIVITGANRGIGLELTKQFAKEHFVYALCRNDFPAEELHDHIKVVRLDITDEKAIKDFAQKLDDKKVAVDLLINNAGTKGNDKDTVLLDSETLTEVFVVNTVAPMLLSIHITLALKRAEAPVMIAISSRMGTHAAIDSYNAKWWPYSASKAALCYEVSAFAIQEPQIKSISVHPGWVKTRMGGEGADTNAADSVKGIMNLYNTINKLESGRLYYYTGELLDW